LIIGYGNPLRSDDGVGWRVADELQIRLHDSRIEVIECCELAPEMAEKLRGTTLVIFVDAEIGGIPGEVHHHRVDGLTANEPITLFSHGRTPGAVLALAAELYAASPECHLFTVSGTSFCLGQSLSPEVAGVVPLVVTEIEKLLSAAGTRIAVG
jgi:hydrogenase maturation protease